MSLRMRVHEREPIGLALRRFKKLLERSGMQKELRKRRHYEKTYEITPHQLDPLLSCKVRLSWSGRYSKCSAPTSTTDVAWITA